MDLPGPAPDLGACPLEYIYAHFRNAESAAGINTTNAFDIDNVVVTKQNGNYLPTTDHLLFTYNPLDPNSSQSYTLDPGCWSDVYGNIYSGSVTITNEFESIVLFKLSTDYTNSPPLDLNYEHHIVSGPPVIWSADNNVIGSIVVDPGATLIVDGATIGFADSRLNGNAVTNVKIKPLGTLKLVNGAQLTAVPGAGCEESMWDGVMNLGASGSSDGMVIVESGSMITHALTGVLCGEGNPMVPGYAGPEHAGMIFTNGGVFENNLHDVVIHGDAFGTFLDDGLMPYFGNTQFRTTQPLHYVNLDPIVHLRVADHGQVVIAGSTFNNALPSHAESLRMGQGIQALNANVAIWPEGGLPSSFSNLDHGVHSMSSYGTPYTNVVQGLFTDNICGVYIADVQGFSILGSTFKMGRWNVTYTNLDEFYWQNRHRAIFSTGGYGFSIQDNSISPSDDADPTVLKEGIVVGYVEDHNDVVFRNNASDLERGFVGEGIDADVNGGQENFIGFQFQCNTNVDNATNLMSRIANGADPFEQDLHTVRGHQGSAALTAGNTFDQDPNDLDFEINTQRVPEIKYYYASGAAGQEPLYYTNVPGTYALGLVALTGASSACQSPGPGVIGGGHTIASLKPVLQAHKLEYGNTRYLYDQLIDGGSTDEVVQEITSTWPSQAWELRDYLLDLSPYLSTEALMDLVNKPGVPMAIKAEILIANPDGTQKDGFLKWASASANYPLPEYIIQAVVASWNTQTYRTELEGQMAGQHANMTQAANHLLYLYQTDTVPPSPDTLRWLWQQVRTNAARFAEAALLMGEGDFTEAAAVISAMPMEKEMKGPETVERERMLAYIGVLASAANDGRNSYQLNGGEVNALTALTTAQYDRPGNWAANLLCAVYNVCRPPNTGGDGEPKSGSVLNHAVTAANEEPGLSVQPNPASDWSAISYLLPDGKGVSQLIVRDISGRILYQSLVSGAEGQEVWDIREAAAGVYSVELVMDGRTVGSERLVVQR